MSLELAKHVSGQSQTGSSEVSTPLLERNSEQTDNGRGIAFSVTLVAIGALSIFTIAAYLYVANVTLCGRIPEVTYEYIQLDKPVECYQSNIEYDAPGWYSNNCEPAKIAEYPRAYCRLWADTVFLFPVVLGSGFFSLCLFLTTVSCGSCLYSRAVRVVSTSKDGENSLERVI